MPRWTAADIPAQSGRTVVVTGANSGIGRVTARELAAARLWQVSEELTGVRFEFEVPAPTG